MRGTATAAVPFSLAGGPGWPGGGIGFELGLFCGWIGVFGLETAIIGFVWRKWVYE
jgi:hypothetical protein